MSVIPTVQGPGCSKEPLLSFSQCHEGILAQLHALSELPALHAAAVQSRNVASSTLALFKHAVLGHHADEESELFPAVLRSAEPGEEFECVQTMVQCLIAEHRTIELLWKKLKPAIKAAASGALADLDRASVEELVRAYQAHARFEEQHFLPLAGTILGRNGNHMAALGLSLHLRHAPQVVGHYI